MWLWRIRRSIRLSFEEDNVVGGTENVALTLRNKFLDLPPEAVGNTSRHEPSTFDPESTHATNPNYADDEGNNEITTLHELTRLHAFPGNDQFSECEQYEDRGAPRTNSTSSSSRITVHHHHHHFYLHRRAGDDASVGAHGEHKGMSTRDECGEDVSGARLNPNAGRDVRLPLIRIGHANVQDGGDLHKFNTSQRPGNGTQSRVLYSSPGNSFNFRGQSTELLPPIPKNTDGRLVTIGTTDSPINDATPTRVRTPVAYELTLQDSGTKRQPKEKKKRRYPRRGQTREHFLRNLRHVHSSGNFEPLLRFYAKTYASFLELMALFKADPENTEADSEAWHPSLREDILDAVHDTLVQMPQMIHKTVLKSIIIAILKDKELLPADEVRALFILIQNPIFATQSSYTVYAHLLRTIVHLSNPHQQLLIRWFRGMEAEKLRMIIRNTVQFINVRQFPPSSRHHLPSNSSSRWWIPTASKFLALINTANDLSTPSPCYPTSGSPSDATLPPPPPLHYTELYDSALDHVDLMKEFTVWQNTSQPAQFSYCQHPFLLSIVAKRTILTKDSEQQMIQTARRSLEAKGAFYRYRYRYRPQMDLFFLNIRIRRSHLVSDSLNEISTKKQDLKKKLKVSFVGEPGLDMGGLAKEWLLLLIRYIFEPDYGMFVYHANSRCYWFSTSAGGLENRSRGMEKKEMERERHGSGYSNSSGSSSSSGSPFGRRSQASSYESHIVSQNKNLREYNLIGVLMGLAVYNSITLDLHFPSICYRKLLSPPVAPWCSTLEDQPKDEQEEFVYGTEGDTSDEENEYNGSDDDLLAQNHDKLLSSFASTDGSRRNSMNYHTKMNRVGLSEAPSIEALAEIMPDVARGLSELLAYEGNAEEDMCMNFQVSLEEYGEVRTYDLKEGGEDIPVTNENRREYVALYIDWVLNTAIYHQFRAFYLGFHSVCDSNALLLLRPEEVEMLVCGSPNINFYELQKVTEYDGYNEDDPVIKDFWEVLESLPLDLQKKFLHFTTGSDRVPVGGMSEMPFKITRLPSSHTSSRQRRRFGGRGNRQSELFDLNDQEEPLPEAHTCFNQLVLPPYRNQETLRQKLTIAISNAEGFGLE